MVQPSIGGDETIDLASAPEITPPPRVPSSVSRFSSAPVVNEGRFVPGTMVAGRYRIIGLLGRGGMGEVYRATDLMLAQSVALKFLPEDAASNQQLLERFHSEVRIARQVSHPNVCRVYDIGEADGLPFISMEYIDGEDLASLLHRIGRLPSDKALEIARKLCAGLAAAHERGIIHRDLKPQNIMLNKRGEVVIMDFGLAAVADRLEGVEARNGTPAYMAPEQLRGDLVTAKSDLYALGLIVYELFTGKRAFQANSIAELLRAEETSRPVSLHSLAADVDPAVEKIVLRCLNPDALQRPVNALAIAAALPGGDPLAAALAAGETPSPEMVAASGKTDGFPLRYAISYLAFVLIGLLAYPFVMQSVAMLPLVSMDFPPAVLENKAQQLASSLAHAKRPVDWASWFRYDRDLGAHLESHRGGRSWRQLLEAQSPIRFFYRQSPDYLLSEPDGDITANRPPMDGPGMVMVLLDSRGQLRGFRAIAPILDEQAPQAAIDAAYVFGQAGFDLANFHEVTPAYAPATPFDSRKAWTGPAPGLTGAEITVELATWKGALASFFIQWPWDVHKADEPQRLSATAFAVFSALFITTGLFCVIFFARRNIRLGRGDRNGAFRIAVASFLVLILSMTAGLHITPKFEVLQYVFQNFSFAVALAFIAWLFYIALEPAVRARWPHSLITWNRLLAGQWNDPRLGSHILIGVAIGVAIAYLFLWRHFALLNDGLPYLPELSFLNGARPLAARISNVLFNAILNGMIFFFLLSGLRALLRYDWLAAIATAALLIMTSGSVWKGSHFWIDLTVSLCLCLAFVFALLRMGLVPTILAIFVSNTVSQAPIGSDFSAWYNPVAVVLIGMTGAIAIYGFVRSQTQPSPPETLR